MARVAQVASEGCFQGSLDDSSGLRYVLLHSASWHVMERRYQNVDYAWTVWPLAWC